jgi:hypothetical protein
VKDRVTRLKIRLLVRRRFVHPESFRLWEALEAGSIPIIEDDAYFDALLSPLLRLVPGYNHSTGGILSRSVHPLPVLAPPPGCPRPSTTEYHKPPHPPPECADVWPALPTALQAWEARLPELRDAAANFWASVRRAAACAVGTIVRHGSQWQQYSGRADLPPGCRFGSERKQPSKKSDREFSTERFPAKPPPIDATPPSGPLWEPFEIVVGGGPNPKPTWIASQSIAGMDQPSVPAGSETRSMTSDGESQVSPQNFSVMDSDEGVGVVTSENQPNHLSRTASEQSSSPSMATDRCHHHDLRCRAREVAAMGVDPATHALLHGSISDARAMAKALFSRRDRRPATGTTDMGERAEERNVGSFPTGPCENDCDCAGEAACSVDGMCDSRVQGHCPPLPMSAAARALQIFVEVMLSCSRI